MTTGAPLKLYNSLTRQLETFQPIDPALVRVYTCGPTVYNYQHIGNMRAFLFADTLGRVLRWKGYPLKHIINITDVGHLTSDADAGDDKMEKAAAAQHKSIWEIAAHYTDAFKADIARLNITPPAEWTVATDHIPQMIEFAKAIEQDCYQIEGGLYFDTSKVPNYGGLAGGRGDQEGSAAFDVLAAGGSFQAANEAADRAKEGAAAASRIGEVTGKRNPADFAIWRKSPPGEQRQMEWDSPWGKGAPGWHLECSVMSHQHLGHPFDIHTGGIDHREIHHPNEIAQNQAFCRCADSGARIWMHNNFLIDRGGKMSKSTGEFLKLQVLVDRGVHPLAYRLMCLQAHYRSELEFTWESLFAALTRLKRLVMGVQKIARATTGKTRTDRNRSVAYTVRFFDEAISDDLNTPLALTELEKLVKDFNLGTLPADDCLDALLMMDEVLGFGLGDLTSRDLRIRPPSATMMEDEIERIVEGRKLARAEKDFARSDAIRDELAAAGVEVMDGDPLGWDWKLT